jgi:hypothetical protein
MYASVMRSVLVALALAGWLAPTVQHSKLAAQQTSSADAQKAGQPRPLNSRVLLITDGSSRCAEELARLNKPGGEFETMRSLGWKIGAGPENHLQLVDQAEVPEIVQKFEIREFPLVLSIQGQEIQRAFRFGCTTPLDAWTFGWLAKGVNERPYAEPSEAARVETTGNYPLRGNHWSIDGDVSPSRAKLVGHLRGPIHGPQIKPNQEIETWSYEELRSLHDNLHEIEMGGVHFSPSYAQPRPARSGGITGASSKALGR